MITMMMMMKIEFIVLSLLIIFLNNVITETTATTNRSFIVDYENNQFLKDGKPFCYVSGSMHYFRIEKSKWKDRLHKLKLGGLNAVQTYVEWSTHEYEPGKYDFNGQNDLLKFIEIANDENLLVILRIGPYICAERDMGGLPYWLLNVPNIKLRTSDEKYLHYVDQWLMVLLPKIKPYLYENGGPIIMLQLENEYGSYGCDLNYTTHLRDEFRKLLGNQIVLFTTDGNADQLIRCGQIPDVLTTIDFGINTNITKSKEILYRHQKNGPFINSEYYSGWIDYWEDGFVFVNVDPFIKTLKEMLDQNASVNIYMYHGGTNFGWKASGNGGDNNYQPILTSYDYDAPISESGDLTEKYFAVKNLLKQYLPQDNTTNDDDDYIIRYEKKMSLPPINMKYCCTIFDLLSLFNYTISKYPLTFEQMNQPYGFLLYQTNLTNIYPTNPAILSIPGLRDRAHIFIDRKFVGILSRTRKYFTHSILANNGSELSILVENQGRCAFKCIDEQRGIIDNVTLNNNYILNNWKIYNIPWQTNLITNIVKDYFLEHYPLIGMKNRMNYYRLPSYYIAEFTIPNIDQYPLDSFLSMNNNWKKGVAYLNEYNLGRYWPSAGPQKTLYAPSTYFKSSTKNTTTKNQIIIMELDESNCWFNNTDINCQIQFIDKHILNGTYAH